MPSLWPTYLAEFESILARPQKSWSESGSVSVWNSLARGPVSPTLFRYAVRKLHNEADAQEALQTCLLELSVTKTYDPQGHGSEAFRKWVYGCLHNHICRFFRLRGKDPSFASSGDRAEKDTAIGSYYSDKGEGVRRIEQTLNQSSLLAIVGSLPPKPREVVTRRLKGESDAEIGQAMGITEVNVRQIASRATRDIRKRFGVSNLAAS